MIGWYVHHHGHGHLNRAVTIARRLRAPVVGLSSLPRPPDWPGQWERLPPDRGDDDPPAVDPGAGGTLHWAPRDHPGLRARMGRMSTVLARPELRAVVVDVSVEVAALSRLHGVPVVLVAQPGDRTDRPHRLAYDLAELVLAPYPAPAPDGPSTAWPEPWLRRTHHLGAISRFDGRPPTPVPGQRRVLAVWGSGGTDLTGRDLRDAALATPGWSWRVLGPEPDGPGGPANLRWCGWRSEVWAELCAADVVVTHAGLNAVAEVAAARRPAVVVAQRRPHAEQRATVRALRAAGLGCAVDRWPAPERWPGLLDDAARDGGQGWAAWSTGHGAGDAAALIDRLDRP